MLFDLIDILPALPEVLLAGLSLFWFSLLLMAVKEQTVRRVACRAGRDCTYICVDLVWQEPVTVTAFGDTAR